MTQYYQASISVGPFRRGFHLITDQIEREAGLEKFAIGQCQVFIRHTSASLTLNENADPTVRRDFESHFNHTVPENAAYYLHTLEGPDDMPAHLKASLLGSQVTVPITRGRLNLGTWQGIYLGEHRDRAGPRQLVITCWGKPAR